MQNTSLNTTSSVLIVTEHPSFSDAAKRQLLATSCSVRCLSAKTAELTLCRGNESPFVAFVDSDAKTDRGLPLHALIHSSLPECKLVLLCTSDQIAKAAHLTRSCDVWDYFVVDTPSDPERVPVLVQRAREKTVQADVVRQQYQQILQTLRELRCILKSSDEYPSAEAIEKLKGNGSLSSSMPNEVTRANYKQYVIELVCGRLRRLENQVLLSAAEVAPSQTHLTGNTILVVEDDVVSADLAKNILEVHGFDVTVAASAIEARDAFDKKPPALVLMDVHLDDASGIELVKLIRRGPCQSDVPVIIVTSDRTRDTLHDAIDVNVEGYLLKPYEPEMLLERVKVALAQSRLEHADAEKRAVATSDSQTPEASCAAAE